MPGAQVIVAPASHVALPSNVASSASDVALTNNAENIFGTTDKNAMKELTSEYQHTK